MADRILEAAQRTRQRLEQWRYSFATCPACHQSPHTVDCVIAAIAGDLFAELDRPAGMAGAAPGAGATTLGPPARATRTRCGRRFAPKLTPCSGWWRRRVSTVACITPTPTIFTARR